MTCAFSIYLLTPAYCIGQSVGHPQPEDTITWGGSRFSTSQLPLQPKLQLWEKASGLPFFKGDTANPRGYVATWQIHRKSLWLYEVKGTPTDKNNQLLDAIGEDSLPCKASWFMGDIYLPIGEFDFEKQSWPYTVRLEWKDGELVDSEMLKDAKEVGPYPKSRRGK